MSTLSKTRDGYYAHWFFNAFAAGRDKGHGTFFVPVYKNCYGLDVNTGCDWVEFPSEDEAILFVLKWS